LYRIDYFDDHDSDVILGMFIFQKAMEPVDYLFDYIKELARRIKSFPTILINGLPASQYHVFWTGYSVYAYFDGNYWIMNEHNLMMGECTNSTKFEPKANAIEKAGSPGENNHRYDSLRRV
jgi:hypothetical protein